MRKTRLSVVTTTAFKKDYKLAMKRGLKIILLEDVVAALAMGEPLPEKNTPSPGIGLDIGNVIFSRTGFWSTALRTMFWY